MSSQLQASPTASTSQPPEGTTDTLTAGDKYHDEDEPLSGEFGEFIHRVSDLVDKYWNGSKSLMKNPRFKCM